MKNLLAKSKQIKDNTSADPSPFYEPCLNFEYLQILDV